jgi:hypothetical protein
VPEHREDLDATPLQFDTVTPASAATPTPGATCENCHETIGTEYFQVNRHVVCERCKNLIEAAIATPTGVAPLLLGGLFGLGAGIAGAAIYYAVIALANLEIGIVAILIGYMVGYAVRKGAGNRGGLRFQILAVTLTYLAVAFAYTPVVISGAREQARARAAGTSSAATPATPAAADAPMPGVQPKPLHSFWVWLPLAAGLVAALPVLIIVNTFPSGVITAIIILIGMRQAWRMTGRHAPEILGPFRVGVDRTPLTS